MVQSVIHEEVAIQRSNGDPAGVADIVIYESQGPWETKSGGELEVLLEMNLLEAQDYLEHDSYELRQILRNIAGLRIYRVNGLKAGGIKGGQEYHRIRKERLFVWDGRFKLSFEDVYGYSRECELSSGMGIYIPPFILHTYEILEDGSIFALANTTFDAEDVLTRDTYSEESFRKLQRQFMR